MTGEHIARLARSLRRRYGGADLEAICRGQGIRLLRQPMGRQDAACKGFFLRHSRVKCAVVNCDLDEDLQRIVLAHEIGHALLHGDGSFTAFQDVSLFADRSKCEYEANLFAAELLLCDEEVAELLCADTLFFAAAGELRVPPELLDLKLRAMRRRGYAVRPPMIADSLFLRSAQRADRF